MWLFDKIDSLTDPNRPRLSRREKMAALFGCGVGFGFMAFANLLPHQPPVWLVVCGASAVILLSLYSLLFIVPVEEDHETRT